VDHDLPFSTWSLPKPADFLVAEGVVDDISHEGLRLLLREEGVSFQAVKTWKTSTDPDYEAIEEPGAGAVRDRQRQAQSGSDDPTVVICMDEFGPATRAHRAGAVDGRPTSARTGCGTCWPATT
jgi:hypothetical protein